MTATERYELLHAVELIAAADQDDLVRVLLRVKRATVRRAYRNLTEGAAAHPGQGE